MKLKKWLFLLFFLASLPLSAQELTVKEMKAAPMDLSASKYERKDLSGQPCGLVKVQLAAVDAQFEGNVMGKPEYKTGEYWVYMTEGSYMLSVKHPQFVPLHVNFRSYGVNGIESKVTYVLTLLMPQGAAPVQTQKLTINYTPANAIVLVDSEPHQGNGHLELILPVGSHNYQVVAVGYETAEGSVKLTANQPRSITEHLVSTQSQPAQPPVAVQQPIQPTSSTNSQVSVPQPSSTAASTLGKSIESIAVKGVTFNMVRVEGGTFQMGATSEQGSDADSDETPVHQVTLSTYYIGETEVTQELWQAVMGSNPSFSKGTKRPVEKVSWKDCQEFIEKLNQETGRQFRLPTEAEWEYAARGGNKSGGYKYAGSNNIKDVVWYTETTNDQGTREVKTKRGNELGLYDMSGNVWEWCQDRYGSYSSGPQTNPTGASSGSARVDRGGSWGSPAWDCRVSNRSYNTPGSRLFHLGLRLALQ